jgi:hypothetical protein
MFASATFWKMKREELKRRRNAFVMQLTGKADDPVISSQLRMLDDEIAECTVNIERQADETKGVSKTS